MQIKEFLEDVCNEIKYKPIRTEISKEIENHIEEQKEEYMYYGISEEEATDRAISQMGDAKEIGEKLNKIHKPKLNWKIIILIGGLLLFGLLVVHIRAISYDVGYTQALMRHGITPDFRLTIEYILQMAIIITIGIGVYFIDYRRLKKYSKIMFIIATILNLLRMYDQYGYPMIDIGFHTIRSTTYIVFTEGLYILAFAGFLQKSQSKKETIKTVALGIISLILFFINNNLSALIIVGITYIIMAICKIFNIYEEKDKPINLINKAVILSSIFILILGINYINKDKTKIMGKDYTYSYISDAKKEQETALNEAQMLKKAENLSANQEQLDKGTDFALVSIIAHYGWVAGGILIAITILLSITLIINMVKIKEPYGKMLTIGITTLFILKITFSILMNLNLGIKTDFHLPFVAYGTCNLLTEITLLSILLSAHRRKDILEVKPKKLTIAKAVKKFTENLLEE